MDRIVDNSYYIYVVFRPNGIPCYVGMGKGNRWKRTDKKNAHLLNIWMMARKNLPIVKIIEGISVDEARSLEITLIAAIGREANGGPLVNMTDGGEGTSGAKMTPEWRAHRSQCAIALWQNPEYRANMLRPERDRSGNRQPRTDEFKIAIAEKLKGNTHTLGLKHTAEARAKMSAQRKGKSKSAKTRAAMAEGARIGWQKRRMNQANFLAWIDP